MHRPAAFLSMVLMLSLLLTQWLGYAHAIAHAHSQNDATTVEISKAGVADHQKAASACAAFDAATLGAGLHSPAITLFVAGFTPSADPLSMIALTVPLIALYLLAGGIAVLNDRRRDRKLIAGDF
jgi:hypothetical protein